MATRRARARSALIPRVCIAVDWCGAIADQRRRMWLAEARLDGAGSEVRRRSGERELGSRRTDASPRAMPSIAVACRATGTTGRTSGQARPGADDHLRPARSAATIARLECGRSRDEIVAHLIECAQREPRLVVGLDFAFSFPRWFL